MPGPADSLSRRGGDPTPQRPAGEAPRAPGIYVHVPFCARVCPYCDFAVQTGGVGERRAFADGLLREIEWWAAAGQTPQRAGTTPASVASGRDSPTAPSLSGRTSSPAPASRPVRAASTVYFGGGTPSSLAAEQLAEILDALRRRLPVDDAAELTLEVNPEDVHADALDAWCRLGFTRLSIGVQSFDDHALALLGRAHRARQAVAAVEAALAAGFEALSVDLIFAIPGQSPESWRATLQQAVDLEPQHVSCYELTVHRGTRFFRERERGRLLEVADDAKAELFFATHQFLADAGYPAYEVSNFARDDAYRSRHNSKYWSHTRYLGIGPSAHSFDGVDRRWWNVRGFPDWLGGIDSGGPVAGDETLNGSELALEALALGLRTTDGVDLCEIESRYGVALRAKNAVLLDRWIAEGLLREPLAGRIRPTLAGMALADTLATALDIGGAPPGRAPAAEGCPA